MKVIDLTEEHEPLFFCCLEDWSEEIKEAGSHKELWYSRMKDASPPRWIVQKKKPVPVPGKVTVTSFMNGWCPAQNMVFERAKRAAAGFGDTVEFQEFNTSETEVLQEWGLIDALFIDGRQVRTGPPPSYEKIRKKIRKKVRKL